MGYAPTTLRRDPRTLKHRPRGLRRRGSDELGHTVDDLPGHEHRVAPLGQRLAPRSDRRADGHRDGARQCVHEDIMCLQTASRARWHARRHEKRNSFGHGALVLQTEALANNEEFDASGLAAAAIGLHRQRDHRRAGDRLAREGGSLNDRAVEATTCGPRSSRALRALTEVGPRSVFCIRCSPSSPPPPNPSGARDRCRDRGSHPASARSSGRRSIALGAPHA